MKVIKLWLKNIRKRVLQLSNEGWKEKNPKEPNSPLIPCEENLYFLFIF